MRLTALQESAPGCRGVTTSTDAIAWIEKCECGEASEKELTLYNQLKTISKNLGGKSTVIEVLKAMK
jgi:hypothetical protein